MGRRWSRISRLHAGAALVCAALAGAAAHAYVSHAARAAGSGGRPRSVVVAVRQIPRGARLTGAMLRAADLPSDYAPPNAVPAISEAAGRVALAGLAPGEVVTETRLARVRAGPVASLTPEGLRAFAVPASVPPDLVSPGDRVDVLATYTGGAPHSETVVPAAEILLVVRDGMSAAGPGIPGTSAAGPQTTLVLLVSPDEEDRLAFAAAAATLSVAIVPPGDPTPEGTGFPAGTGSG